VDIQLFPSLGAQIRKISEKPLEECNEHRRGFELVNILVGYFVIKRETDSIERKGKE
jgi:hypothetical protein